MAIQSDPPDASPDSDRAKPSPGPTDSPEAAFQRIHKHLDEFADYLLYYLLARFEAFKFAIKRRILMASIVAVAVLAAAGMIITAVFLLCQGISDGLSDLFHHRWAGELATGVLLLGGVSLCGFLAVNHLINGPHRATVRRYEELRRRQRRRHGHDVKERATGNNHG